MCPFSSIYLGWHAAHMFRCICFLTALLLSLCLVLRGLKLLCAKFLALLSPLSFMLLLPYFFLLLMMSTNNTIMYAVIWEACSLMFPVVLSHADLSPIGILLSQWLDITKSLAELGEMGSHPAAASITQGMTGTKSASWLRRSSLTSR